MQSPITCAGVNMNGFQLPAFELHPGSAICLHLSGDWQAILPALTGQERIAGLQVNGRSLWAAPALSPRGIWALLKAGRLTQPKPWQWLVAASGMTEKAAHAAVARLGLEPHWRLCELAGNPRVMLGLEAAWGRGAEAIIFATVGMDPAGMRDAFAAVSKNLDHCPAIYLSTPYETNGMRTRSHMPNARCCEVVATSPADARVA